MQNHTPLGPKIQIGPVPRLEGVFEQDFFRNSLAVRELSIAHSFEYLGVFGGTTPWV